MIKSFTVFFGVLFTILINIIFGDGVKVSQNVPSHVNPGDEFTIEITVNKSDVKGFAKIQQELPQGFQAEVIDAKGASFTFNDNKVKLIWMSIPEDEEFTITYKVKVGEDVQGIFDIKGKFSYLYNNQRKVVDLPVSTIKVGEEPVEEPAEETPLPPATAQVERLVEPQGTDYILTLNIKKENLSGFAKIEEMLPSGVQVKEIETKGAVFSFVNNKAKFVWMKIPEENNFSIQYKVSNITDPNELIQMPGHMSYLDNEETKRVEIVPASQQEELQPQVEETEPVAENLPEETNQAPDETNTEVNQQLSQEEPETVAQESSTTETFAKEETKSVGQPYNIPETSPGISYRVQICAGHKQVNVPKHFKSVYKFEEEPIKLENHEGWLKYTIGNYQVYKNAKERRNDVTARYDFPGPFVTAYNDGKRITVQEALMITHQKWYK